MKRSFNLSAAQMALLSGLGCLIASSGFLLTGFVKKLFAYGTASFYLSLVLAMVLVIAGVAIYLKTTSNLSQGVENAQWPPEQVAVLRNLTKSPWWWSLMLAFLLVAAVMIVLDFWISHSSPYQAFAWIGLIFVQGMTQLQRALRQGQPPDSNFASLALNSDWRSAAPLRSSNWGQH